jgi:hypothetical protein
VGATLTGVRALLAVVLAATTLGACSGPCKDGPDILLRLEGDAASFAGAATLSLVLTIDGKPVTMGPAAITGPLSSGTTVLLVPSTPPAGTYQLGVTATLLDAKNATLATGTMTFDASNHACNRATLSLASSTRPPDAGTDMGDLAQSVPFDMATADLQCVPTTADEDKDGLSDPCDVCAANANPTPTDTDGDGVPDACDPDPSVSGNHVLLFEPFNAPLVGWSGKTTESNGMLVISTNGCVDGAERAAGVGADVQLQTYVTISGFGFESAGVDQGELGIFAVDSAAPSKGASCFVQYDSMAQSTLVVAQGNVLGDPNFAGVPGAENSISIGASATAVGATDRLRLTVHDSTVTCELVGPGGTKTVSEAQTVPFTNLLPVVGTCYAQGTFSSVFAVSDP